MKPLSLHNSQLLPFWLISILLIAGLSVFGRKIQLYITDFIDQRWIAGIVFLLLIIILVRLHASKHQRKFSTIVILAAVLLLVAGVVSVYRGILQPVEAVHFLLFSWLGWISAGTFGVVYGAVAVIAVSFGDEVLQHFLPDRVGDMHDIVINTISGGVGLLLRGK